MTEWECSTPQRQTSLIRPRRSSTSSSRHASDVGGNQHINRPTSTDSTSRRVGSTSLPTELSPIRLLSTNLRISPAFARWLFVLVPTLVLLYLLHTFSPQSPTVTIPVSWSIDLYHNKILSVVPLAKSKNPAEWLHKNSNAGARPLGWWARRSRPKAALISLVRNEELEGILQSMRQLEFHWNKRYQYPWIFFNEVEFTDRFKVLRRMLELHCPQVTWVDVLLMLTSEQNETSAATDSETYYYKVPHSHWATPSWINLTTYYDSLDYLGTIGVGKASMLSYRNMCRWQSGFFYRHPALAEYEYYWRVEPDVHFFCDIHYDPFRFLRDNGLVYGFNMAILDDARSFATLWADTLDFVAQTPELVHPDADVAWLLDEVGGYNNCQFFSNFEIGSLEFFQSAAYEAYFRHLDKGGGFYYSRYGDAPVHTLSLSLFAPKDAVWFFRDIGYQHDIARHCPPASVAGEGKCSCEPTSLDENFYKLVPMESPQWKPADTCIRKWLGGEWTRKAEGWDRDTEIVMGGDGYGGYVVDGMSSQ